jgi:hypothetical protein
VTGLVQAGDEYRVGWSTLDAGGEIDLAGGPWRLSATIGQVDAQSLGPMTGGSYALEGGFWAGVPAATGGGGDALFRDGFEATAPVGAQTGTAGTAHQDRHRIAHTKRTHTRTGIE